MQPENEKREIDKLFDALKKLDDTLDKNYALGTYSLEIIKDNPRLIIIQLMAELHDIRIALHELSRLLQRLTQLTTATLELDEDDGQQRIALVHLQMALTKRIPIYIKFVYHSLYNISKLYSQTAVTNHLISQETERELDRVLLYRNKVIVHRSPSIIGGGYKYGGQSGKFEIIASFSVSEKNAELLNNVFEQSNDHLPLEVRGKQDMHDRLDAIYRYYNLLPRNIQRDAEEVIAAIGVISSQPSELAELAGRLASEITKYKRSDKSE